MVHRLTRKIVEHVSRRWSHARRAYFNFRKKDYDAFLEAKKYLKADDPSLIEARQSVRRFARESFFQQPRVRALERLRKNLSEKIEAVNNELGRIHDDSFRTRLIANRDEVHVALIRVGSELAELERTHIPLFWETVSRHEAARISLARMGFSFGKDGVSPPPQKFLEIMETIPVLTRFSSYHPSKGLDRDIREKALKLITPILGPLRARRFYKLYNRVYANLMRDYFSN